MRHIFYGPETSNKGGEGGGFFNFPATEAWLGHHAKHLALTAMLRTPGLDFFKKQVVVAELETCERKKDYAYRHPNFRLPEALEGVAEARLALQVEMGLRAAA